MDTEQKEKNELVLSEWGLQTVGTSVKGVKVHKQSKNESMYTPYSSVSFLRVCLSRSLSYSEGISVGWKTPH